MKRRLSATVAMLACAALALTGCDIYDVPLPGGADVGSHPMKLHVKFHDVLDLVPQSTVKVDDITVGKITSIKLDGYTADVTIEVPSSLKLPTNEQAEIRQTSLLGEKFVSLEKPATPSTELLKAGDVIPLKNSGRNPEVEEVLKALASILSGGGVAQLKTIATELNQATDGREGDVRSVLDQIHFFMGQLAQNKTAVVAAITNVDRLARSLHAQDGTIRQTLRDLPGAVKSVNSQRADLVKMLQGLNKLSDVGVRVINASKEATIDSLSDLAPVLNSLAKAGQDLPKSLQIALTYPFLDAAVGNSPEVARNLHMGDWVNLSIMLDLNLNHLTVPGLPDVKSTLLSLCKALPSQLSALAGVCASLSGLTGVIPSSNLLTDQLNDLLGNLGGSLGGKTSAGGKSAGKPSGGASTSPASPGSGLSGTLGGLLHGLGLGRANLGAAFHRSTPADPFDLAARGYDPGVGTLLLQGVVQ